MTMQQVLNASERRVKELERQLADSKAEAARLRAALRNGLRNEGIDGCCLPMPMNACHCWRCQARAALEPPTISRLTP